MTNELSYSRIATKEKLSDRFLSCQVRSAPEKDQEKMGKLIFLVEITNPWFPTSQIGQTIINVLTREYYQQKSTSDLENFENALKKVNESLAQITQNGETDWIGKLNAVLALVCGTEIHIAQTGKVEGYLFRNDKSNKITVSPAPSEEEIHPLKTFSAITSGSIEPSDKLILSNTNLYDQLSPESVKEIVKESTPPEAASHIMRMLKRKKSKDTNAIIFQVVPEGKEKYQETFYLDQPLESPFKIAEKYSSEYLKPALQATGSGFVKLGKAIWPNIVKFNLFLSSKLKRGKMTPPKEVVKPEQKNDQEETPLVKETPLTKISDKSIFRVHDYQQKPKKQSAFSKIIAGIINFFSDLWHWLINPKNRKIVLLIIVILLIAGLTISALKIRSGRLGNKTNTEAAITEAKAAYDQGKMDLLYNEADKAKQSFALAIEKASTLPNSAEAKKIIADSLIELDKLTNTTRFSELSESADFASPVGGIFVVEGNIYAIDNQNKKILKLTSLAGKPVPIDSYPSSINQFSAGALGQDKLWLYSQDSGLYELPFTGNKISETKLAQDTQIETSQALAEYGDNLYLLDSTSGQIWKHGIADNQVTKGKEYLDPTKVDIKDTISLAIDGEIYVLKADGTATKLARGKALDFNLTEIPTPFDKISKPLKIVTDKDTASVYILDGKDGAKSSRILEFDKSGKYLHQYALPDNFDNVKDFAINSKSKKAWILDDSKVYEIAL